MKLLTVFAAAVTLGLISLILIGGSPNSPKKQMSMAQPSVERGHYLVTLGGCNDCHSPKIMTPQGPMPDTTIRLSGHPVNEELPSVPAGLIGPTQWGALPPTILPPGLVRGAQASPRILRRIPTPAWVVGLRKCS